MVKCRLYRLCRTLLTQDWPKYIYRVVESLNNTPNSAIGFLKPSEIKSAEDDPKVDAAIGVPQDISFQEQQQNQKKYENDKTKLQVNDFVYKEFPVTPLEKGFDTKVY